MRRIDKWTVKGTFLFFNPPKDGSPLKLDFGFIAFIKYFSNAQLGENQLKCGTVRIQLLTFAGIAF